MPDAPSEYPRSYNYFHPHHRRARGGALSRSRGRCQGCGYWPADDAHHWLLRYLPPWATTSDHLTALCRPCHRVMTLLRRFLSVGGDVGRFLAIVEAALAEAGESVPRTGRALRLRGGYGARAAGRTHPRVGELDTAPGSSWPGSASVGETTARIWSGQPALEAVWQSRGARG